MLEETVSSIWSSMASWFTPTFLFLLLNLVIGIIAVSSAFGSKHKPRQQQQPRSEFQQQQQQQYHQQPAQLARAPSSVLERLKSINLYHFRSEDLNPFHSIPTSTHQQPEPVHVTSGFVTQNQAEEFQHQPQLARAPSILERLKSINLYHFKTEDFNPFPNTESSTTQHQILVPKSTHVRKQSKNQNPDHDFLNHRALTQKQRQQQAEELQQQSHPQRARPLNYKNKQQQQQQAAEELHQLEPRQQLARAPSILERLKSINLYNFKPEDLNPFQSFTTEPASVTQHQKTVSNPTQVQNQSRVQNPDDDFLDHRTPNKKKSTHQQQKKVSKPVQVRREPQQEEPDYDFDLDHRSLNKNKSAKTTRPAKMKLVRAESHIGHFGEVEDTRVLFDDEPRRPSTTKASNSKASHEDDEEVDAKADDFINRFKQQLKLQRLDSIKDLLRRGTRK